MVNKLILKSLIFVSLILEVFLADLSHLTHSVDQDEQYTEQSSFSEQGDTSDLAGLSEIVKGCNIDSGKKEHFLSFIEGKNLLLHYSKSTSLLQLKDTLHIDLPPPFIA